MAEEQRFAYGIHEFRVEQRARMAAAGKLNEYRGLRLIITGTAGTGKSRTVLGITELRQRAVREACLRRGVPVDEGRCGVRLSSWLRRVRHRFRLSMERRQCTVHMVWVSAVFAGRIRQETLQRFEENESFPRCFFNSHG